LPEGQCAEDMRWNWSAIIMAQVAVVLGLKQNFCLNSDWTISYSEIEAKIKIIHTFNSLVMSKPWPEKETPSSQFCGECEKPSINFLMTPVDSHTYMQPGIKVWKPHWDHSRIILTNNWLISTWGQPPNR
jgi:hypothetical protein